jgi:hypothetical protein
MRAGIDTLGPNHWRLQAAMGQVHRQPPTDLIPVRGWTTRADHRNCVTAQKSNISKDIQEGGGS